MLPLNAIKQPDTQLRLVAIVLAAGFCVLLWPAPRSLRSIVADSSSWFVESWLIGAATSSVC